MGLTFKSNSMVGCINCPTQREGIRPSAFDRAYVAAHDNVLQLSRVSELLCLSIVSQRGEERLKS